MNRTTVITIVLVLCFALGIGGLYLYFRQFIPKYTWYPTYREYEEEPYDISILYNMMEDKEGSAFELIDDDPVRAVIDSTESGSMYFFLGHYRQNMDTTELEFLKSYAENGNDVVLISEGFQPFAFRYLLNLKKDTGDFWQSPEAAIDSIIQPEIVNSNHKFSFHYQSVEDTVPFSWNVLSNDSLWQINTDNKVNVLGYLKQDSINFAHIPYGEGGFYFHSNPVLFSNYMLLKEDGLNYLNAVFRNFKQDKIYWDIYNKSSHYQSGSGGFNVQQSPLNFILGQKEFSWAWYICLALVLIYVFFQSKRKQRIIPVIPAKKNTSVEYAKALGSLFFDKENHLGIAKEMLRQFWIDVRTEHQLPKQKLETDAKSIHILAEKSQTRSSVINGLLEFDKRVFKSNALDTNDLNHLYNLLQHYYSKTEKS